MTRNQRNLLILGVVIPMGLVGCDRSADTGVQESRKVGTSEREVPPRNQDFQQILRGGKVFQQNCASCHGKLGQGAPNWRQRNEDGTFPAPPLNGEGHTWHHSMEVLKKTVRDGTAALGGSMPAWGDKLSEQEIRDVLAWVQAQWPDEIYARWYQNNQRKQ